MELACPPRFCDWLAARGEADVLTSDYRLREGGADYQLAFLAAQSAVEKLGILRFALLPPAGQLAANYHLPSPRWGYLMYGPFLVERSWKYATAFFNGPRSSRAKR